MSEPQRSSSGGSTPPGGDDDGRTCLRSLRQFVDQEKVHLRCAARGPEELRYVIYRCAFTKVEELEVLMVHGENVVVLLIFDIYFIIVKTQKTALNEDNMTTNMHKDNRVTRD